MKNFPVGIQLYSVRDDMAADFKGTVEKIAAMGYDCVEFAGLFGKSAEEVKKICKDAGVEPVSAHVALVEMMSDPEGVIGTYEKIGCKYIVIPYLPEEFRPGHEKFEEVIADAKMLGEVANRHGMTLLYHNHDFEFTKINGKYALDVLYEEVPASLLKTQLDVCWVNVGGEDPSGFIEKYSGRTPVVHLKDFVMPGKKPEKMYALIGIDDGKQSEEKESEQFQFRPVGYGVQNFEKILNACEKSGAEYVIVEQDSPSMGKTPLECAEMSIKYLRSIGV